MNNFFIDTNVLLDWLIPTNSFHAEATSFIKKCFGNSAKGFVSSHSLTDIFYILRKHFSAEDRKQFLLLIVSNFIILTENNDDFLAVLNFPDFFDLEDGLQMKCAENANLDYIVTENVKDFSHSKIPAISIGDAISKM